MLSGSPELSLALVAVPRRDEPELLSAEVAGVWLFTRVSPGVRSKLVTLGEAAAAVCALVRLLARVDPLVGDPVLSLLEHLAAVAAFLALVPEVGAPLVAVALVTPSKLLAAVRAEVALSAVVNVGVTSKPIRPRKGHLAVLALVRLDAGMNSLAVVEHRLLRLELLATVGARSVRNVFRFCQRLGSILLKLLRQIWVLVVKMQTQLSHVGMVKKDDHAARFAQRLVVVAGLFEVVPDPVVVVGRISAALVDGKLFMSPTPPLKDEGRVGHKTIWMVRAEML